MEYKQRDIPGGASREEFLSSLKAPETENYLDRIFYRKQGFLLAKRLIPTGITPNTVTIISIVFGVLAGPLFYLSMRYYFCAFIGIAFLVIANVLDCTDGQLSRMTGLKSKIGRILDGVAGDLWFLSVYIFLALALSQLYDTQIFWFVALLSMLSHFLQAAMTDYYKTVHLRFIDQKTGAELETAQTVRQKYISMSKGTDRFFFTPYLYYTLMQTQLTPQLQQLLRQVERWSKTDIPSSLRLRFRKGSLLVMKAIDLMTFNGRSVVLFLAVILQSFWIYFAYEIVVLNIILFLSRSQHEALCEQILEESQQSGVLPA